MPSWCTRACSPFSLRDGTGHPFLFSALLLDQVQGVFTTIKKHSKLITIISGLFLLVFGVALTLGFNPAALFL
jgi:cytochrome c-type biogenesis protein